MRWNSRSGKDGKAEVVLKESSAFSGLKTHGLSSPQSSFYPRLHFKRGKASRNGEVLVPLDSDFIWNNVFSSVYHD